MKSFKLRLSAALVVAACVAGCSTVKPVPVPAGGLTEAQASELDAQAQQDLAAGNLVAAGQGYIKIVGTYPQNAVAWFKLGTVYLRTGQVEPAQRAFEQALRADPRMTKANANLALAHLYQFRNAARRAIVSSDVAEENRRALESLLRDIDHALAPATVRPVAAK